MKNLDHEDAADQIYQIDLSFSSLAFLGIHLWGIRDRALP